MAKAIGIDDSVTTCDCCGKSNLRNTVIMQLDDGTIAHYGSVCACNNTGKSAPAIRKEIADHHAATVRAARAEYDKTPEWLALQGKFAQRPRTMVGRAAAEFIRAERIAADAVCREIAARHGVQAYEIY